MLDSEDKYRLLLQVSEAANAQLEFAGVLDAVARALTPIVPIDAIGVVSRRGDRIYVHAIHVEGINRWPPLFPGSATGGDPAGQEPRYDPGGYPFG